MTSYADTSFLASLYCRDANSAKALSVVQSGTTGFPVSDFLTVEIIHAFQARVFRGEWNSEFAELIRADFLSDLETGLLCPVEPSWPDVFKSAASLAVATVARCGNRTLDTLRVASAVMLGAKTFYSFDVRQRALAAVVGLNVWQP